MSADPIEQDDELVHAIRSASGPLPDAAARVALADAAWARAGRLRSTAPAPLHRWRTLGLAAAAGLLVAVSLATLIGRPDTALAVEGDPVQVWDGADWRAEQRVETDRWVFTPPGTRRVVLADGSALQPSFGTVFIVRRRPMAGSLPFHVEVRSGSVSYDGDPLALTVADVDVMPAHGDAVRFDVVTGHPASSPPEAPDAVSVGLPRVSVRNGSVIVRTHDARNSLRLFANEAATMFVGEGAPGGRFLTRVRDWSPDVVGEVMQGRMVFDAAPTPRGGVMVVLGGQFPEAIEIDAPERAVAIRELNQAMQLCETLVTSFGMQVETRPLGAVRWSMPRLPHVAVTVEINSRTTSPFAEREHVLEVDGATTTLYTRTDGSCQLVGSDGTVTEFARLSTFVATHRALARQMRVELPR